MGSACSVWTTGFAPSHDVCAFPIYTAQAPGCSAGELSKVGPCVLPRSKLLRFGVLKYSTKAQIQFGMHFVPFPGQRRSGNQVLAKRSIPGGWCSLITSPIPAALFPGCTVGAPPQVCRISLLGNWSLAETLLADVNCVGSQEDLVSN